MDLDQYQDEAMQTMHWPRFFTELQVRQLMDEAYAQDLWQSGEYKAWQDLAINDATTPFNLVIYPMIGALEEVGELAGKIKKIHRDQDGELREGQLEGLMHEAGDMKWYGSAIDRALGFASSAVAKANITKLRDREARGVLGGSGDHR